MIEIVTKESVLQFISEFDISIELGLVEELGGRYITEEIVTKRYAEESFKMLWNQYGYDALGRALKSAQQDFTEAFNTSYDPDPSTYWGELRYKFIEYTFEYVQMVARHLEEYVEAKGLHGYKADLPQYVPEDSLWWANYTAAEVKERYPDININLKNRWGYAETETGTGWRQPKQTNIKPKKPKFRKGGQLKPKKPKFRKGGQLKPKKPKKPTKKLIE